MLNRRLKLGTYWGIGLYVHWTFALLLGFVAYQSANDGAVAVAFSMAIVMGVFFCVTLHEYGHALTARRFGIPTIDITLLPIGGVARLQRMPRIPWQELVVAVAGPAVNVVIASVLAIGLIVTLGASGIIGILEAQGAVDDRASFGPPSLLHFAVIMMVVNIMLVLFNMIPAFPMDGGRVLRSVMAMTMSYRRATVLASRIGLVCAGLMVLVTLSSDAPNPILLLIAVFIGFAGVSEARQVEVTESVRGLSVRNAMVRSQISLPIDMPLSDLARAWQSSGETAIPVLSHVGTVVGMLRLQDVCAALASGQAASTTAGELIDHERSAGTVGVDDSLESVVLQVGNQGRQLAVVDRNGRLVGILDLNTMLHRGQLSHHLPEPGIPDDRFDAIS